VAAQRLTRLLLVSLIGSELDARLPLGIGARQTGAFQIIGTMLDVRLKFFFHLSFHLRAMKERRKKRA
jgi:hypothetical protein